MQTYKDILMTNQNGVLATSDEGKIKTRVFQVLFVKDKKVYFCTNSEKDVYKQLMNNPEVSFCCFGSDFNPVLSVNGLVVFEEDRELKKRALNNENPYIKAQYETVDNPIFKLFYIDIEECVKFTFMEGVSITKF